MRGKALPFNADHAIRDYQAGESLQLITTRYTIGKPRLERLLTERGLPPRPRYRASEARQAAACLRWQHMSPAQRQAQVRAAHQSGAAISAGNRRRWAKLSQAERDHLVQAAHQATKGRPLRQEHLLKLAASRAQTARQTPLERALGRRVRDLRPVPQFAIGPYNCDLAIHPVAVEVWGGGHHGTPTHRRRDPIRIRYFLDAGWSVYVIHITPSHPLTRRATDDLRAFVEQARRHPSAVRQYRMVWGTGESLAAGRADDDHISLIPALTRGRNPATGQYQAVPR